MPHTFSTFDTDLKIKNDLKLFNDNPAVHIDEVLSTSAKTRLRVRETIYYNIMYAFRREFLFSVFPRF